MQYIFFIANITNVRLMVRIGLRYDSYEYFIKEFLWRMIEECVSQMLVNPNSFNSTIRRDLVSNKILKFFRRSYLGHNFYNNLLYAVWQYHRK